MDSEERRLEFDRLTSRHQTTNAICFGPTSVFCRCGCCGVREGRFSSSAGDIRCSKPGLDSEAEREAKRSERLSAPCRGPACS